MEETKGLLQETYSSDYEIVMFANPRSGSTQAKKWLKFDKPIKIKTVNGILATLSIFNLIDP